LINVKKINVVALTPAEIAPLSESPKKSRAERPISERALPQPLFAAHRLQAVGALSSRSSMTQNSTDC
jgi:hypothetical protein